MKTFKECILEAADRMNATGTYNSYQAILDFVAPILQTAADIYSEQSNSHKHSIVRGGDFEPVSVQQIEDYFKWLKSNAKPNTPTEPLPAEGHEQNGSGGKVVKFEDPLKKKLLDQIINNTKSF